MPVLDPHRSPNAYYQQSPFLFWSIVSVACRSYPPDISLYRSIATSIMDLALLSINTTSKEIFSIQGLLLVLTWAPSRDDAMVDISYPLAGLLIHRAKQFGLHIPRSSHEFPRGRKLALSEADIAMREELWAWCMLVYQRACSSKGYPSQPSDVLAFESRKLPTASPTLPDSLKLQLKCQDILTRCYIAVTEIGLRAMTPDQERALDITLRTFEHQLHSLDAEYLSSSHLTSPNPSLFNPAHDLDRFHICASLLNIQAFHFHKHPSMQSASAMTNVVSTCIRTLDAISRFQETPGLLLSGVHHVGLALLVSTSSLQRIIKCPTTALANTTVDYEAAKSHYHLGIDLLRKVSDVSSPVVKKSISVMVQLHDHPSAFRDSSGEEDMVMRIKSRLTLSTILDAFWRWCDLFDEPFKDTSAQTADSAGERNSTIQSLGNSHDDDNHVGILADL